MVKKQLELLVALQDLDIMIREVEDVKQLGFEAPSLDKLEQAREELKEKIGKPLYATYERLKARYKRAIVPVKGDTCLGCFMRLPTSLAAKGREDAAVITCENCGRILYWLE
ncbi:MAG: C4-type zinc ribbon domain-containing protein [candidate division KSB1 bacterium]|nr:C4-type zinc ribbon domain-containing protein [candidate division KSB1 bacterium]MDZ7295855.1 C4-type zinc ribbon domain-containing protein [candidate division KSB1 bacterium]MDZ7385238.1 C4-type zinc ribbon domain-containing protein [candidate division KSB1 bacterium]MDZ7393446.1 C4-type zinc ribbon domain-containing protein [candidate division KSB1 bacterium]MDZ7414465.1 C4-type zinc ribbon domain-containing protein [candidate division KSB1 bacterium]